MDICKLMVTISNIIAKHDEVLDQKALITSNTDEVLQITDIKLINGRLVISADNGRN